MPVETPTSPPVTRLAPSPTGALHLGNARTFLFNWGLARTRGWRLILRIEDLDTPRTKRGADQQAIDDLAWLGMDWDEGPHYQLNDLLPYRRALRQLHKQGVIYPCICSRREIEQAQSAPHGDVHEVRYPGTCRPIDWTQVPPPALDAAAGADGAMAPDATSGGVAWRLHVPDELISFNDELHGPQHLNVQQQVGDFIVATKAGLPAYQLAVVVDDARQGVTDVVRGDDLLRSTARQLWLYRFLKVKCLPRWWHLPLVIGPDGRRLAKRHGDTRIAWYRQRGVPPWRIVGLLAYWCGLTDTRQPMSVADFRARFDIKLPLQPVRFTAEDHEWLLER